MVKVVLLCVHYNNEALSCSNNHVKLFNLIFFLKVKLIFYFLGFFKNLISTYNNRATFFYNVKLLEKKKCNYYVTGVVLMKFQHRVKARHVWIRFNYKSSMAFISREVAAILRLQLRLNPFNDT